MSRVLQDIEDLFRACGCAPLNSDDLKIEKVSATPFDLTRLQQELEQLSREVGA
jgi:hypothetical protein